MGNEQTKEIQKYATEQGTSKLSEKVKYQLKVVIQGHRGTGKTSLWKRLQDLPFEDNYKPTPQTQKCFIGWNYKASDDVVAVELWDVAENGKDVRGSLEEDELMRGTNAVILVVDPFKRFTWDFTKRRIKELPNSIQILIVSNFRDLKNDEREVKEEEMRGFIDESQPKEIHYFETSIKNRYGTKSIGSFLNLPFIKMRKQILEKKLAEVVEETSTVDKELNLLSKEQNYDFYLKWLEQTNKNRGNRGNSSIGRANLSLSSPDLSKNVPTNPPPSNNNNALSQSASAQMFKEKTPETSPSISQPPIKSNLNSSQNSLPNHQNPPKNQPNPPAKQSAEPPKKGFFSRLFSKDSVDLEAQAKARAAALEAEKTKESLKQLAEVKKSAGKAEDIDQFVVGDGEMDAGFFDDDDSTSFPKREQNVYREEEDSEEENSLVTREEDPDDLNDVNRKRAAIPVPKKETKKSEAKSPKSPPAGKYEFNPAPKETKREEFKASSPKAASPPLKAASSSSPKNSPPVASSPPNKTVSPKVSSPPIQKKEEKKIEVKKEEEKSVLDDFDPNEGDSGLNFEDEDDFNASSNANIKFGSDSEDEFNPLVAGDAGEDDDDEVPSVVSASKSKSPKEQKETPEAKEKRLKKEMEAERAKKAIEEQKKRDAEKRAEAQRQREIERQKEQEKKKREEEAKKLREEEKRKKEERRKEKEALRLQEEAKRGEEEEKNPPPIESTNEKKEEEEEEILHEKKEEVISSVISSPHSERKERSSSSSSPSQQPIQRKVSNPVPFLSLSHDLKPVQESKSEDFSSNSEEKNEEEPSVDRNGFEALESGGEEEEKNKPESFDANFSFNSLPQKNLEKIINAETKKVAEDFSDFDPNEGNDGIDSFLSGGDTSTKEENNSKYSDFFGEEEEESSNPAISKDEYEGLDEDEEEEEQKKPEKSSTQRVQSKSINVESKEKKKEEDGFSSSFDYDEFQKSPRSPPTFFKDEDDLDWSDMKQANNVSSDGWDEFLQEEEKPSKPKASSSAKKTSSSAASSKTSKSKASSPPISKEKKKPKPIKELDLFFGEEEGSSEEEKEEKRRKSSKSSSSSNRKPKEGSSSSSSSSKERRSSKPSERPKDKSVSTAAADKAKKAQEDEEKKKKMFYL
eukprot:TRINITY_DN5142_c0_g1_i2.p1 TRINITY_DN5142_c0_g1~~TRINITY_DN5142_c0_g1_i2.p1  ORF type:complete len:1140 (-),score=693.28 TRINITY_DN5142_c0_g1_i2:1344-4763(-)